MLIGEKVCLGPVLNGDAPLLFNWFDTFEIAAASGPYRPSSEAQFTQWVLMAGQDPTRVLFAIRKKADMRLIGHMHVSNMDPVTRSADVGIGIGPIADRRQGFGQEALGITREYCWRVLNLQRLSLRVHADNPWAQRAYVKAGFQVEGRLRRATYAGGVFQDVILMAALRPDP